MNMYKEATEHLEKCDGCEYCVAYEESAYNISKYYKPVEKEHPLLKDIIEKFDGIEIS
tara:strand:+ start:1180 stop:1353 length:174 start_codon:yes stop_codon:yes gene_type:complete